MATGQGGLLPTDRLETWKGPMMATMTLSRQTPDRTLQPALPAGHRFFVSVHVPKTAGTTLGVVLDRVFRKRVLMDYPDYLHAATPDPDLVGATPFLRRYFRGIHGHFNVMRHAPAFPDACLVATLRHPVDRIISQYLHEWNDDGSQSRFHRAIAQDGMDVVDFARQDGIGDAMLRHLSPIPLPDYDLLLISETMMQSLHLLNFVIGNLDLPQHFGQPPVLPRENRGTDRKIRPVFDAATRRAVFDCATADVEVYRQAVDLLAAKSRRFLK
jgi:Sulfotransferase family